LTHSALLRGLTAVDCWLKLTAWLKRPAQAKCIVDICVSWRCHSAQRTF
jgi:hypothetical protein